jgi:hypothetical protein
VLRSEVHSDSGPSRARPAELDRDRTGSARGAIARNSEAICPAASARRRQASEGSSEDRLDPKPRSLACFERRKPPLGAVFWVFDLRRASLGVGQGRNKVAPTAVRVGAPGRARALSSLNT